MHGNILTKEELSLPKARAEVYVGMIFANWDPGSSARRSRNTSATSSGTWI